MLVYVCCATGNITVCFANRSKGKLRGDKIYVEEIHELGNHLEDALRKMILIPCLRLCKIIDENSFLYHFEYRIQAIWLAPPIVTKRIP